MTTTEPQGSEAGPIPQPSAPEVIRSEEQLRVGTRTEVTGRVLVRKLVTSEEVARTLTLRREELSVEHLPAEGGGSEDGYRLDQAEDGQEIELVLHEERVVIITVPVERVTVRVHRVSEDVAVSEFLRRERIALDVVPSPPATPGS
jgi:uncharacterized protein (TIGR02271 family)